MREAVPHAQQKSPWKQRYDVRGSVITTPGTLHVEVMMAAGEQQGRNVVMDATGIFMESGKDAVELKEARLGTDDIGELCARGRRCFFTLAPTSFRVAFYDEQLQTKLGELLAQPLPVAGNPGVGVACWYITNPSPAANQPPQTLGLINLLLNCFNVCKRFRKPSTRG